MKICLVSAFPPSRGPLNEYALCIARELQRNPNVELTIMADELTAYEFSTTANGGALNDPRLESPGFNVIRCWKPGSISNPMRLLKAVRRLKPDVVWFHVVFSSFGTPDNPVAAFTGLTAPALMRAAGFYTHITLHQVIEHVDFAAGGVHREKVYRAATNVATRALLKAHSVSVLLSGYRQTLVEKYSAENVLLGTHGTFTTTAAARPPDLSRRGNPDHRILAFGNWGTYKKLETLMAAFPSVLKQVPNARLIVAGANHPARKGYWESVRDAQPSGMPIEFRGYIPREEIPELFETSSLLVMPYNSATGSSGPAHQACEYGLPIVCADVADFQDMAANEDMAIQFYKTGNANDLAGRIASVLRSRELQFSMAERNFAAGIQMAMETVVGGYLRWFALKRCEKAIRSAAIFPQRRTAWLHSWFPRPAGELDFNYRASGNRSRGLKPARSNILSIDFRNHEDWPLSGTSDGDGLSAGPTFEYGSRRRKYSSDR